jgi:hypothetical protein
MTTLVLLNYTAVDGCDFYSGWVTQETPRKYAKPTYTENDLKGDPRFEGKMMWRMT